MKKREWRRALAFSLAGMMAAIVIGCNEAPAPAPSGQPEAKTAPPPPGRSEKAKGKMGMPHL